MGDQNDSTNPSDNQSDQGAAPAEAPVEKPAERLITIRNKTPRLKTFNLAGEAIRDHADHGYSRIVRVRTKHDPASGAIAYAKERVTIPSSLRIPGYGEVENLPRTVLSCDEIRNALKLKPSPIEVIEQSDQA